MLARGRGKRSLAQEVQQAAIAAIDVDGQRAPLANEGKSLETLCSGQNIFRMERAAKTPANSVPRDSSHTSLLRKVYDAVVPSAEADVFGIFFLDLYSLRLPVQRARCSIQRC